MGESLLWPLRIGNGFSDLAFLVGFGIVAIPATQGDHALEPGMLELAVRAFLAIQFEACSLWVGDQFPDFAWHGVGEGLKAQSRSYMEEIQDCKTQDTR
jgi:hypothetical protein